ncbi:hypothetical protein QBC44DRAFT_294981 [Cladorrhinum sp. PSN332]|nr:hypothetical protein QBC44DRAFT_294981 [Cladorrhinum sp. PSN332]
MLSCCFCLGREKADGVGERRSSKGEGVGSGPVPVASGAKASSDVQGKEHSPVRGAATGREGSCIDTPADHRHGELGEDRERGEEPLAADEQSREGLISLKGFDDPSGSKQRVDIVAVHGLNGHPIKTWKEDNVIWFAKFLPSSLPELDLRISSFGYNSRVLGGGSVFRVRDFATQLLASLHGKRSESNTERVPLIFICHSLGGIVFKKMLTIAHERQSLYSSIADSTKGVAFFGTPHCGSDVANASRVIRDIVSFCTVGAFRADLLRNLERSSDELVEIAAQFVERAIRLHIVTVYEGRPVGASVGPVVVGKVSAVMNLPNEHLIPIDADHREVCRFSNQHDERFESILPTIRNMIRESVVVEDTDIKACLDMLYFPEYRARRNNVSPAHHTTFDWIWKHPKYRQWENSRASSLMWLQGKPGSGKSTLANFVGSRVGSRVGSSSSGRQTIVVDFFYSARGGSRQNRHFWMLRSILYQFMLQVPGLWHNYQKDFRDRTPKNFGPDARRPGALGLSDENGFWDFSTMKSLFASLGSIHSPNLRVTAYVIIDALDESAEIRRQEIIDLLCTNARRDHSWPITFKIFLTSRPSPKIEQALRRFDSIVLEDETGSDIVHFVQSETKRIAEDILACDIDELSFISTYLIKASNGVFLWVKLVLEQLDERATDGFCSVAELEQLLLSIPRDLRDLYRLILDKINKGSQSNAIECQTVFRWIAYSPVPLQIEQVLEVVAAKACSASGSPITRTGLQRHRVGNTEVMRRRLISLCGNLVEVKGPVVQFIHTTVREFLMEEACSPSISLAESDSLDEICSLGADYLNGFKETLEQDPWLAMRNTHVVHGKSFTGVGFEPDLAKYSKFIDEFSIVKLIFEYSNDPLFQSLPKTSSVGLSTKEASLRHEIINVIEAMKPLLVEALARSDDASLDSFILHKDQLNCPYPIPKEDSRFNQPLACSPPMFGNSGHTSLLRLVFLRSPLDETSQKILHLLCIRGADTNLQDASGSTPLHTALQLRGWARDNLAGAIEDLVAPRLVDGFLSLDETLMRVNQALYNWLKEDEVGNSPYTRRTINNLRKVCVLVTSVIGEGYELFDKHPGDSGFKITRSCLQYALPRVRSTAASSAIRHEAVWSLLLTMKSLQESLVRELLFLSCDSRRGPFSQRTWRTKAPFDAPFPPTPTTGKASKQVQSILDSFNTWLNLDKNYGILLQDLLAFGANPRIANNQRKTPIDIAMEINSLNNMELMLSAMKRGVDSELGQASDRKQKEDIIRRAENSLAELAYTEASLYNSSYVIEWLRNEIRRSPQFPFSMELFSTYLAPSKHNKGNICGGNILHMSAARAQFHAVINMLQSGMAQDVLDEKGRTAKDIAKELGHVRVLEMFRIHEQGAFETYVGLIHRTRWSWDERRYVLID